MVYLLLAMLAVIQVFKCSDGVKVIEVTSNSVTLSWSEVNCGEDCNDISYTVRLQGTNGTREITTTGTSINIDGLIPYTRYTAQVIPSPEGNYSGPIQAASFTTKEAAPSSVRDFHLVDVTSSSLTVAWIPPKKENGVIQHYRVFYKHLHYLTCSAKLNKTSQGFFETTVNNYTLLSLMPNSKYEIAVRAFTVDYGPSKRMLVDTEKEAPRKVKHFVAYSHGENWISVRWQPADIQPCDQVESYILSYKLKTSSSSNVSKKITVLNSECHVWKTYVCHTINALIPNNMYDIEIVAVNVGVFQSGESSMISVATVESAPTAPLHLQVTSTSTNKMSLMWEIPDLTHGMIRTFEIEAVPVMTGLADRNITTRQYNVSVKEERMEYHFELDSLEPSTHYIISVRGVTMEKGPGDRILGKTKLYFPIIEGRSLIPSSTVTQRGFDVVLPTGSHFLTLTSAYFIIIKLKNTSDVTAIRSVFLSSVKEHDILGNLLDNRSYIAGEVKPHDSDVIFHVGKSVVRGRYGTYYNPPVEHEKIDHVKVVLVNEYEGEFLHYYQAIQGATNMKTDHSAAAILFGISLGALISVILYGQFLHRRWEFKIGKSEHNSLLEMAERIGSSTPSVPEAPPTPSPVMNNQFMRRALPKPPFAEKHSYKVMVSELESYVESSLGSGALKKQYKLFSHGEAKPAEYGKLPQNVDKNRYTNLIAYDQTRVVLEKLANDEFSDYINANYVDGYKDAEVYIATQAPLPHTVNDFWRMVWQDNVQIIIMLNKLVGEGKTKCEKYWPQPESNVKYGDIRISTNRTCVFADYIQREMSVSNMGKERQVIQLQFTSWADKEVLCSAHSLASLIKRASSLPSGSGPILVHSSAGVGRTGVVILSHACLQMGTEEGFVDVLALQQAVREQRPNMLESFTQYKLVHLILVECLFVEDSSIPCQDLFKKVQELKRKDPLTAQSGFNRLFRKLNNICERDQRLNTNLHKKHDKGHENTTVPHKQLFLAQDSDGAYVCSAVFVDGFRKREQFIAMQYPPRDTISDFWKMIRTQNSCVIVVLNDTDKNNKDMHSFWPAKNSTKLVRDLDILNTDEVALKWYVHRTLKISSAESPVIQDIHMLHVKGWSATESIPPDPDVLLELWNEVDKQYDWDGPITLICNDGTKACGLFLAIGYVLEKLKLEKEVDVFLAVRSIRKTQPQFINKEQYEYCYRAALQYLKTFETYANFY